MYTHRPCSCVLVVVATCSQIEFVSGPCFEAESVPRSSVTSSSQSWSREVARPSSTRAERACERASDSS